MASITDGFGREMNHGEEQMTRDQMASLLNSDVKIKNIKKPQSESESKAVSKIETLLEKILKEDIGEELKKLSDEIKEAKKIAEKYYERGKKDSKSEGMGDVTGLSKAITEAVKNGLMSMKDIFGGDEKIIDAIEKGDKHNKEFAKLADAGLKKGSIYTHDSITHELLKVIAGKKASKLGLSQEKATTPREAGIGGEIGVVFKEDDKLIGLLKVIDKSAKGEPIIIGLETSNTLKEMKKVEAECKKAEKAAGNAMAEEMSPRKKKKRGRTKPPKPTPPEEPKKHDNPWDNPRLFHKMFKPDRIMRNVGKAISSDKPATEILSMASSGLGTVSQKIVDGMGWVAKKTKAITGLSEKTIDAITLGTGSFIGEIIQLLVGPMIEEMHNIKDIRQTAYQTLGINVGANDKAGIAAQDEALKKYNVTREDMVETGESMTKMQQTWLRNLKRGIRDAATLNRVSNTGLNIANMLGSSVEETANLFADMHQNLGMGVNDLSQMGLGFRDIARSTGITGDKLIQIARSSEQFMKNMRNAGVLTTTGGTNITRLMAESNLTGTQDSMQKILAVMSKGMLAGGGDQKTRDFLLSSAGDPRIISQLLSGTLANNSAGMRQLGMGIQEQITKFLGGRRMEDLGIDELGRLSQIFEETFGFGIKEAKLLADNLVRANRKFSLRYAEYKGEGPENLEKRQSLVISETIQYLNELKKQGGSVQKLLENMPDFADFATSMNLDLTGNVEESLKKLITGAGEDGGPSLSGLREKIIAMGKFQIKDPSTGIATELKSEDLLKQLDDKNLTEEKLRQILQIVANQTAVNQDPVRQIEQKIKEVEAFLREKIGAFIVWIQGYLPKILDFIKYVFDGDLTAVLKGLWSVFYEKLSYLWTQFPIDVIKAIAKGSVILWDEAVEQGKYAWKKIEQYAKDAINEVKNFFRIGGDGGIIGRAGEYFAGTARDVEALAAAASRYSAEKAWRNYGMYGLNKNTAAAIWNSVNWGAADGTDTKGFGELLTNIYDTMSWAKIFGGPEMKSLSALPTFAEQQAKWQEQEKKILEEIKKTDEKTDPLKWMQLLEQLVRGRYSYAQLSLEEKTRKDMKDPNKTWEQVAEYFMKKVLTAKGTSWGDDSGANLVNLGAAQRVFGNLTKEMLPSFFADMAPEMRKIYKSILNASPENRAAALAEQRDALQKAIGAAVTDRDKMRAWQNLARFEQIFGAGGLMETQYDALQSAFRNPLEALFPTIGTPAKMQEVLGTLFKNITDLPLFKGIIGMTRSIRPAEGNDDAEQVAQPLLSGIINTLDTEMNIRRNQVEAEATSQVSFAADDMNSIEENTEEMSKDTKKVIALLDSIRRLLSGSKKTRRGSEINEDIFEEVAYEAVLDTTWMSTQVSDGTSIDTDIDRT